MLTRDIPSQFGINMRFSHISHRAEAFHRRFPAFIALHKSSVLERWATGSRTSLDPGMSSQAKEFDTTSHPNWSFP
jgi:hypothetical protein